MRDDRRGGGVGTAPAAARTAPGTRPADPARARLPQRARRRPERAITAGPAPQRSQRHPASHPGDALERPRNNPSDEEDPPEQTTTTTLTLHILKTAPE